MDKWCDRGLDMKEMIMAVRRAIAFTESKTIQRLIPVEKKGASCLDPLNQLVGGCGWFIIINAQIFTGPLPLLDLFSPPSSPDQPSEPSTQEST